MAKKEIKLHASDPMARDFREFNEFAATSDYNLVRVNRDGSVVVRKRFWLWRMLTF